MKVCFKCGKTKSLEEFYRHPAMADGHLGKCKDCTKLDVSRHRLSHLEQIRAYDRRRGSRQGPEYRKQYRRDHPEKYTAHTLIGNSLRDSRITKPDACAVCGAIGVRIFGHHADYSKPLDVVWCCQACHKALHARIVKAKSRLANNGCNSN